MVTLPFEIEYIILDYLNDDELLTLKDISKRWNQSIITILLSRANKRIQLTSSPFMHMRKKCNQFYIKNLIGYMCSQYPQEEKDIIFHNFINYYLEKDGSFNTDKLMKNIEPNNQYTMGLHIPFFNIDSYILNKELIESYYVKYRLSKLDFIEEVELRKKLNDACMVEITSPIERLTTLQEIRWLFQELDTKYLHWHHYVLLEN